MTERRASRTALMVAAFRARASRRDGALMSDPWADELAGPEGAELAARVDAILPDRELWIAVRTAVFDAQVERFTAAGARQIVVLGAGFDTRAARLARAGVRFFEVDHPASQREKYARIARIPKYPVDAATFVTCDFEHEDFLDRLAAAGFDPSRPALILWEGVTPYLYEAAVRATLRRVASACEPRTAIVFDHLTRKFVEGASKPAADREARSLVEELGERFVFGTNDALPMLYEEGFRHVEDRSFEEWCLELTGSYVRERQFRFQRIVLASRVRPASMPTVRVARPTDRLDEVVAFYRDGLGIDVLGAFSDHDGFDGTMLGKKGQPYHLEFTRQKGHTVGRAPTQDHLLVFYLPDRADWQAAIDRMIARGHSPVASYNPYWDSKGKTFEDPDGYRVVLQNARWPA